MVLQFLIDVGDFAAHRTVEIGRRLDRLDDAQPAANIELLAKRRQLEIDDVAQLRLGVLGYPYGGRVTILLDPLVALAESHAAQVCHRFPLSVIWDELACKKGGKPLPPVPHYPGRRPRAAS